MGYRPLTQSIGGKSGAGFTYPDPSREYGTHLPSEVSANPQMQMGRSGIIRNNYDLSLQNRDSIDRHQNNHRFEVFDDEKPFKDNYNHRSPSYDFSNNCMDLETIEDSQPHHLAVTQENCTVTPFRDQINQPGCNFIDFDNIPFSSIWLHLISKRVVSI